MRAQVRQSWKRIPLLLLGSLISSIFLVTIVFALEPASLILRPHCEKENASQCPAFEIIDPQTMQTPLLKPGNMLDLDLVVHNPASLPIRRVRAWLAYDPSILAGEELTIGEALPIPTPGEAGFDPDAGYAQLETHVEQGRVADMETVNIARIRFRIKEGAQGNTPISFHDVTENLLGHTLITSIDTETGEEEKNVLGGEPGSLLVRIGEVPPTPQPPTPLPPQQLPPPPAPSTSSTFPLLQVQNLRINTEDDAVYLSWDPLLSSELVGYNLYYSAISGEYVHRRSAAGNAQTAVLRGLPQVKRMFFAVRGVNRENNETAFSREVAVTVGQPTSSTSPLMAQVTGPARPPRTDGALAGKTGVPSLLFLLLMIPASIGTAFACHRQLIAIPSHDA